MTLTKKLLLTSGAAGGLALAALGYVRIFSGHWEPITVDNPKVGVNFSFKGHKMRVTRVDGLVTEMSREITSLLSVIPTTRNGKIQDPFKVSDAHPIVITLNNGKVLTFSWTAAKPPNQLTVNVNKLFGACLFDSVINNNCAAADENLRMHTIDYWDDTGEHHYCLNAWELLKPGSVDGCAMPDPKKTAQVYLKMAPE